MKARLTTVFCAVLLAVSVLRTLSFAEEPVLTEPPVPEAPAPAEAPPPSATPAPPAADNLPPAALPAGEPKPEEKPAEPVAVPAPVAAPAAAAPAAKDAPVEMVKIADGDFLYGEAKKVVVLKAFQIDRTEVTVDQYRKCVNAGKCLPPGSGDTCNWATPEKGSQPVNCVDWIDADTFCRWAGKRLPTEAEWEKAARGPDGRTYPWGEAPADCDRAVMAQPTGAGCGQGRSWAVCSKTAGDTPEGACDMAGNLWEYTTDAFGTDQFRAIRGGSWSSRDAGQLRTVSRTGVGPHARSYNFGFRCAK